MRIELVKVNETLITLMMMEWGIHLYMALDVSMSDRVFLASPRYLRLFFATSKIASPSYHLHSVPILRTLDLVTARLLDRSFTPFFEGIHL
jgi:hypothetical protein